MKRFFFKRKEQHPDRLAALFEDAPEEPLFLQQIIQKEQQGHERNVNVPADLQIDPESAAGSGISFSPEYNEPGIPPHSEEVKTIVPDDNKKVMLRGAGGFFRIRKKSPEISGLPEHRYQEHEQDAAFFMDKPQAAEVRSEPFTRIREKSPEISGLPEYRYQEQEQEQEQEHDAAFFMDEPQAAEVRSEPFIRFREQEPSYRMPEVRAQEDGNLQKIALYSGRQLRLIRKMCGMLKEQNRYYS